MRTLMKNALALGAIVGSACTISPASAALYVKADIGQLFEPNAEVSGFDIPLSDDLTYSIGGGVSEVLGPIRLEGEVRKINTDVGGILDANSTILFANAFLDLNQDGKLQPFVGGGVGLAKSEVNLLGSAANADSTAWQAIAGVGYKVSDKLILDASVRYIDLGSLDFGFGADVEAQTSAATIGLRALL